MWRLKCCIERLWKCLWYQSWQVRTFEASNGVLVINGPNNACFWCNAFPIISDIFCVVPAIIWNMGFRYRCFDENKAIFHTRSSYNIWWKNTFSENSPTNACVLCKTGFFLIPVIFLFLYLTADKFFLQSWYY